MESDSNHNEPMRILAIVSHPDDEIGIVGTLKNHADRGDEVYIAWMTRGEMTSVFDQNEYSQSDVGAIRMKQGEETARIIGAQAIFLDFIDSDVPHTRDAALQVARIIRKTRPSSIITWSPQTEGHPDHRNTGKIVMDATTYARIPRLIPELPAYRPPYGEGITTYVYGHATYSNPLPKLYVDITAPATMDAIDQIIEVYKDIFPTDIRRWKDRNARYLGKAVGFEFAELFYIKRLKGTFSSRVHDGREPKIKLPLDTEAVQYLI